MQDKNGRTYAKMSELSSGALVEVDADFTCLAINEEHMVHEVDSRLCLMCDHGYHFLDGQLEDSDGNSLIGVYHAL